MRFGVRARVPIGDGRGRGADGTVSYATIAGSTVQRSLSEAVASGTTTARTPSGSRRQAELPDSRSCRYWPPSRGQRRDSCSRAARLTPARRSAPVTDIALVGARAPPIGRDGRISSAHLAALRRTAAKFERRVARAAGSPCRRPGLRRPARQHFGSGRRRAAASSAPSARPGFASRADYLPIGWLLC